jgi:hypothetical protein
MTQSPDPVRFDCGHVVWWYSRRAVDLPVAPKRRIGFDVEAIVRQATTTDPPRRPIVTRKPRRPIVTRKSNTALGDA